MSTPTEKYLSPKELSAEMRKIGLIVSVEYIRAMLGAGAPHVENGSRMFAQLSRVLAWWEANPGFAPRSEEAGVLQA